MKATDDPFEGKWKLNLGKSKLDGRAANIASKTMTVSKTGPNTFRTVIDSVSRSGQVRHSDFSHIVDGKEHFLGRFDGARMTRTEIYQSIDMFTWKITQKRVDEIIEETTLTVSADHDAMTEQRTYPNHEIWVFDKH